MLQKIIFAIAFSYGALGHAMSSYQEKLMSALKESNTEAFQLVLTNKFDLNFKDEKGFSPLYYAIKQNNPDFVRLLLECGADAHESLLNIPLFVYAANKQLDLIVKIMLPYATAEEKSDSLTIAAFGRKLSIVSLLKEDNVSSDIKIQGMPLVSYFQNENDKDLLNILTNMKPLKSSK